MHVPRPESTNNLENLVSVEQLEELLVKKRASARPRILGQDIGLGNSGFTDTTNGAVLTSEEALSKEQQSEFKRDMRILSKGILSERK